MNEHGLAETEQERGEETGNALIHLSKFNVTLVKAGGLFQPGDPRIEIFGNIAHLTGHVEELLHAALSLTEQLGAEIDYDRINAGIDHNNEQIAGVEPVKP